MAISFMSFVYRFRRVSFVVSPLMELWWSCRMEAKHVANVLFVSNVANRSALYLRRKKADIITNDVLNRKKHSVMSVRSR